MKHVSYVWNICGSACSRTWPSTSDRQTPINRDKRASMNEVNDECLREQTRLGSRCSLRKATRSKFGAISSSTERTQSTYQRVKSIQVGRRNAASSHPYLSAHRYLLHDLIKLTAFRQKDIISEIYQHVYPITNDTKSDYSIASLKLPAAQDRIYQTSLS